MKVSCLPFLATWHAQKWAHSDPASLGLVGLGALIGCFRGLGSRSGDFGLSEPLAAIGKTAQLQDRSSCTGSVTRLLMTARHMQDAERALGFPDAALHLVSHLILNVTPVQEAGCLFPLS